MNLDIEYERKFTVIQFKNSTNLDHLTHKLFRQRVMESYRRGGVIIINFENVDGIDSAGLSALIYVRKKITESRGALILAGLGKSVQESMRLTGLIGFFQTYNSLEAAARVVSVKHFDGNRPDRKTTLFLQVRHEDDYSLVKIKHPNSLSAANCRQFGRKIQEYFERSDAVIVNFDNIRSIDSTGIAMLIDLKHYAKQKYKNLILVYNNRIVNRLFRMYSLEEILPQFESMEEALFSINSGKNLSQKIRPAYRTGSPIVKASDN